MRSKRPLEAAAGIPPETANGDEARKVLSSIGHEITDERRTQFGGSQALFGTDAQDLWLRNLLQVARSAEQAGRRE